MALVNGGGYAEYCTTGEHTALPIPHGYTFVEAAAIPESFLSAWMLLKFYGKVQEGQRVLIHAGSSNLGMAASQITETIMKATAITTSSSEHIPVCKRFASIAISRKPNVFGDHFCGDVRAAIGDGVGVDVVIDPIFGGTYTQENAALLSDYGKILVVSYVGGARLTMNALPLYRQRARISFCQLRTMTDTFKKELVQSFEEQVIPYMNEKMVIPTVFRSFPLDQVATVHTMLDENKQRSAGKYVLTVEETASRSSAAGTQ
ncbi:NADPH2:quinone reductase [Angomonas deanei]|nr:NADPH2:quinone reductase [Angomonas deanei]|eukprot:EPY33625.1 NADPH2:quinone reductase [Angomonas deanei]